ncbi:glycosyltransferase, partial [Salmonella enterica subsp. enterica serovar Minnesota]|uniref:glycosyltransferase n=1 Tax=Salmonella enterica TaxID=28901 RepID=UPI003D29FBEA
PAGAAVRFFKRAVWKFILRRADGFICYSTATGEYLKRFGITEKVFIAYNSIDTAEISELRESIKENPGWEI